MSTPTIIGMVPHPHVLGCRLVAAGEEGTGQPRVVLHTNEPHLKELATIPLYQECVLMKASDFYELINALQNSWSATGDHRVQARNALNKYGPPKT